MKTQPRASADDDDHRVIPFRPRTSPPPVESPKPASARPGLLLAPDHLARFQRTDEPDDFSHRMRVNLAAMVFTLVLTAIGIWLASSIANMRKSQDCVLMGQRDCAHISSRKG